MVVPSSSIIHWGIPGMLPVPPCLPWLVPFGSPGSARLFLNSINIYGQRGLSMGKSTENVGKMEPQASNFLKSRICPATRRALVNLKKIFKCSEMNRSSQLTVLSLHWCLCFGFDGRHLAFNVQIALQSPISKTSRGISTSKVQHLDMNSLCITSFSTINPMIHSGHPRWCTSLPVCVRWDGVV